MANKHNKIGLNKPRSGIYTAVNSRQSLSETLRIFNKKVDRDGVIKSVIRRFEYEKPSIARKRKKLRRLKYIWKNIAERKNSEAEASKRSVTL